MIGADDAFVDFISLFETRAEQRGDHVAVISDGEAISYRSLNERANFLAEQLGYNQSGDSNLVGIAPQHGIERVIAVLAAMKSGYGYILVDAAVPDDHIVELIDGAQCALVICSGNDLKKYETLTDGVCRLCSVDSEQIPSSVKNPQRRFCGKQVAYIRHTSGSTGSPKWVIHNQETALVLTRSFIESISLQENDRVILFNTFWHSLVHGTLARGATLCLYDLRKDGVDRLGNWLKENKVTVFCLMPSAFRRFCETLDQADVFQAVKTIILSGEVMTKPDITMVRKHFESDCKLVNAYGCSELAHIAYYTFDELEDVAWTTIPVGFATDGLKITIDGESNDPQSIGEVLVFGPHVTSGYWGRKDLNDQTYLTDQTTGDIIGFRTGDFGWIDDHGCLFLAGRQDRQVKVNGFRIQLNDVESTLLDHPEVNAVAVKTFPADYGDNRLVAYIVPSHPVLSQSELRLYLAGKLPNYMLPDTYVELKGLPQLKSGKIDYSGLTEPQPDEPTGISIDPSLTQRDSYAAPRDSVERGMSVIWERILKISPIGITDNFFEFGGDSLGATQLVLELEERLGLKASLADLYENPTIEALVPAIGNSDGPRPIVIPLNNETHGAPLFFVCGVSAFQTLSHELNLDQPIIAIDVPDETALIGPRRENGTSLFDVPKLASAYVDLILQHHAAGPYRLAGHSFGGTVAIETASQLLSRGKTVELVLLLDSFLPNTLKINLLSWCKANYKNFAKPHFAVNQLYQGAKRAVQRMVYKDKSNEIGLHPFPDSLNVVLVKATEWPEWREVGQHDYGWSARLNHDVDVYELQAGHIEIVRHPHVCELAGVIGRYL